MSFSLESSFKMKFVSLGYEKTNVYSSIGNDTQFFLSRVLQISFPIFIRQVYKFG